MNPNQVRTINVRYSMVFMITMATLFIFSQVIDYLFYDFTIVETEIVFIKRVDEFNNMQIELNEIVESQNSLVQALKSNLKNKIEYIQKRISFHYQDETDIFQLEANMGYKQDININSKAYLLKSSYLEPYGETVDSLYIMSIQNKVNEFGASFMLNIYQDHGTNFFDMAQQINLNFIWNKFLSYAINGSYISDMIQDYNQLLLVSYNELYLIDQLKHKHSFYSIPINQTISSIALHGNHIVFCNNHKLFHHLIKIDETWQQMPIRNFETDDVHYLKSHKVFFIKDRSLDVILGVVYLKQTFIQQGFDTLIIIINSQANYLNMTLIGIVSISF